MHLIIAMTFKMQGFPRRSYIRSRKC